ncbi:hypothetical protein R1sor_005400 [Riccia sorocarpa]|uniref:Uncharacterized protein n=1 Tax=Riccia sorocarpa TaxID=122646 RepID=A0ABD3HN21_9MARC
MSTLQEMSSVTMAYESWPTPADLNLEAEFHNEPNCGWVIDYFKKIRSDSEILLRISYQDKDGKEKAKDLGTVCLARPNDAGLEVWYEVLRNKQIRKKIMPMQTLEIDDLVAKGEGGLQDVAPDLSENYMLADGICELRFTLLRDQKSKSCMWWFLQKCYQHEIDVKDLGKVPVSVIFKKTDKAFNFETYMESKGMKVKAADTGEATDSQLESSKKKKSKKSLDSTKKTLDVEKTKKTKTKSVNTSSDVEAIKKTDYVQETMSSGQI